MHDNLIIMAEELVPEGVHGAKVTIWAGRGQMAALAHRAAGVVAAGRPICPLCREPMDLGDEHVCVRGNGRKRILDPGAS